MKRQYLDIHGILVLDKPSGLSSNRVLQKVRHLFRARKAGHTGNLDPLATGVLPLCFGEATKYSQLLLDSEKSYLATARFGVKTDTADSEGSVIEKSAIPDLDSQTLGATLRGFEGTILQVPPMYSALKVKGVPLYRLAREGKSVERKARTVQIAECSLVSLDADRFQFRVRCSKGTYVRTLIEDIAASLDTVAHMTALRREISGSFNLGQAVTLENLEALASESECGEALQSLLLPIDRAVASLPKIIVSDGNAVSLIHGQTVTLSRGSGPESDSAPFRIYRETDKCFIGLGRWTQSGLKPHRMLGKALVESGTKWLGQL